MKTSLKNSSILSNELSKLLRDLSLLLLFTFFMSATYGQQRAINTKVSTKKVVKTPKANLAKVPLFQVTNKDVVRKVNYSSKSVVPRNLPKNTKTTILPSVVSSSKSKLNLQLTPRKVYSSKGYLTTNGHFNAKDNEIWLDLQASDNLRAAFSAKSGKSYLVHLELNNAHNDFIQGASKCDNPKLIIQLSGVQNAFDITTGVNKLEFIVQARSSGFMGIPIRAGSCSRTSIKPKLRFKKITITEL
ncbi:hypothetical protein WIW50_10285 [Flavobacteriaceae bacterium 3-367]